MGKRKKSSRKPGAGRVKLKPLETTFQCLFCNHNESVVCKLDKTEGLGQLHCKVCGQRFSCTVNYLSEPIDVYSEWIDASEKAQERRQPVRKQRPAAREEEDLDEDAPRGPTPLGDEEDYDE
ncbi:Elf1-domain-containing protein [Dacryopinax primogenitus]|uniref:Transcription elongation factor 1 homolog n=1 Tax=Dacryopinax primogenitus (strain DJM 731) TaxID=1858805 RepID=M5GGK6_DACPD|nr:Elf1-domain-containing protein [Dacryopinax primogenitus]EJU05653.1 Elf1-domain-containing protein [Dacryopinax primogenitus]